MRSSEIADIYRVLAVPENLQTHMIRVAAVARSIGLDEQQIAAAYLHDVGNLWKFADPVVRDEMTCTNETLWTEYRDALRERFEDDHDATVALLDGLVEPELRALIERIGGPLTLFAEDRVALVKYADLRVDPNGIVELKERLDEAIERYRGTPVGRELEDRYDDYFGRERELAKRYGFDPAAIPQVTETPVEISCIDVRSAIGRLD